MKMRFPVISFVAMVMDGFILTMDVGMLMGMFMGVLQADGIFHHQNSGNDHNGEAHIELDAGNLFPDYQSDHQTAKAGEGTLDGGDLNGGLGAAHPGAVVFRTPAAGGLMGTVCLWNISSNT